MIPAKAVKPFVYPWNNDCAPAQIDRAQDIGGDLTLNQTKIYEIGREDAVGTQKGTPDFKYSMTQLEYGNIEFWRKLANKEVPGSGDAHSITLEDLKTPVFDIAADLTDDNTAFLGSIVFPKLRVNGLNLNIGSPDANIERTFDLVGEDYHICLDNHYAYAEDDVVGSGSIAKEITLNPVAVEYESGTYIYKVLRVRAGVVSELEYDAGASANTYAYNSGTAKVTIQTCLSGDKIKVYYFSATATQTWVNNVVDPAALMADTVVINIKVGVGASAKVYRLQSVAIATSFERADYKEIGNSEVVQTGVKSKTVTITLGRLLELFTIEQALADNSVYPFLNPRDFVDTVQIQILVYSDNTHTSFKLGYLYTGLSASTLGTKQAVQDYNNASNAVVGDNMTISDVLGEVSFI